MPQPPRRARSTQQFITGFSAEIRAEVRYESVSTQEARCYLRATGVSAKSRSETVKKRVNIPLHFHSGRTTSQAADRRDLVREREDLYVQSVNGYNAARFRGV